MLPTIWWNYKKNTLISSSTITKRAKENYILGKQKMARTKQNHERASLWPSQPYRHWTENRKGAFGGCRTMEKERLSKFSQSTEWAKRQTEREKWKEKKGKQRQTDRGMAKEDRGKEVGGGSNSAHSSVCTENIPSQRGTKLCNTKKSE